MARLDTPSRGNGMSDANFNKARVVAAPSHSNRRSGNMLYWAFVFLVIAIIAGIFGFVGIAGAAASIAKVLFGIFIIVFVALLLMGLLAGRAVTR
jgi:uncharacterized membrane protein YtjA (UPF0391 family)